MSSSHRPSRYQTMFSVVTSIAQRGTCERLQVGAVLALEGRILSTGYNGAPAGLPHCLAVGCEIDPDTHRCVRTVHAEANAIAWAARYGVPVKGSDLYCTDAPCLDCAKLLINAGIQRVYYKRDYPDHRGLDLLTRAGVVVMVQDAAQS
jgi:dCMP deaminase